MLSFEFVDIVCQAQHAWDDAVPHDIRVSPFAAHTAAGPFYQHSAYLACSDALYPLRHAYQDQSVGELVLDRPNTYCEKVLVSSSV
jgi:hypothetical protein